MQKPVDVEIYRSVSRSCWQHVGVVQAGGASEGLAMLRRRAYRRHSAAERRPSDSLHPRVMMSLRISSLSAAHKIKRNIMLSGFSGDLQRPIESDGAHHLAGNEFACPGVPRCSIRAVANA